jgi:hypothetical protein
VPDEDYDAAVAEFEDEELADLRDRPDEVRRSTLLKPGLCNVGD